MTESSGRWDATGSFEDAVSEQRNLTLMWAANLDIKELYEAISTMAADANAFTLYERKALLEVISLMLDLRSRRELSHGQIDWSRVGKIEQTLGGITAEILIPEV